MGLVVATSAEAPRFRANNRFLARQQAAEAPYAPSGWKPTGPSFSLPTEQRPSPSNDYGTPGQSYGTPEQSNEPATEPESDVENVATAIATAVAKGDRLTKPKSEKLTEAKEPESASVGPFYYIVPGSPYQNLVLAAPSTNMQYLSKLQAQPATSPYIIYSPQYYI